MDRGVGPESPNDNEFLFISALSRYRFPRPNPGRNHYRKDGIEMIRNLKALGLAFLAIFAMGAIAAGSAQAQKPALFTAESYPATLDGEQEGEPTVFARGGRTVTCEVAKYSATLNGASGTTTVHPTYENCHSIVLGTKFDATVTFPKECNYIFHATADVVNEVDTFTAVSDLVCPEGQDVAIDVYKAGTPTTEEAHTNTNNFLCAYTFTNQEGLKTIDLTNKAAEPEVTPKDWITADIGVEGVTSLRTHGGALTCGPEHHTTGTLTGLATLKGTNAAGEANGITVSTE